MVKKTGGLTAMDRLMQKDKTLVEPIKKEIEKKNNESNTRVARQDEKPLKQEIKTSREALETPGVIKKEEKKKLNEKEQFTRPVIEIVGKKGETSTRKTFYLDKEIIKKVDDLSELTGVPKGRIVTKALEYYFSLVKIKEE